MTAPGRALVPRVVPPLSIGSRRAIHPFERSLYLYRRTWLVLASGFFEPLFYLFAIGFGIGSLVGTLPGPDGQPVPYAMFVAPALLASSSMNGAIFEVTFNVYGKLRWDKVYDAMLATPLAVGDIAVGEIAWALFRGLLYATGFVLVIVFVNAAVTPLIRSPLFVLAIPAAILIGFAFASVGMAATTYARGWQDFDLIQLVLQPLFLFSGTFFPISTFPAPIQLLVQLTPLYHGVELIRSLSLGVVGPQLLVHVVYLLAMGVVGLLIVARRLDRLLLK
ncbi:MAG TPA: ABC transporter permease [Candidatus Limnocylindrales bacterium]|nr:ABC transporter permease [Candidatus Limnocylindrales bacterium]